MADFFPVAPMDKTARLMSGPFTILMVIFSLGLVWLIPYLFSPHGYKITSEGIIIKLKTYSHFISKEQIKSVDLISSIKPGVGLNWLSGQFGYAGEFALENGKTAHVYATRWNDIVQIQIVGADPYILSPQNPMDFINSCHKLMMNN